MTKLGVNIDHVATLRQARREFEPDPIAAAIIAEKSGADSIVCHLREDRRHIQDMDVKKLKAAIKKPLNLEMAVSPQIIKIAARIRPDSCMFVPEKREEITTEGGLNVLKHKKKLKHAIDHLSKKGITISIFIDPQKSQIKAAKDLGADIVELHTGGYANAKSAQARQKKLKRIKDAARYAKDLGLIVHAGHGLKYHNVQAVARIKQIDELNIGHSIISEAVFSGLAKAVRKMKKLCRV